MNHALAHLAAWLNLGADSIGRFVLAPLGFLPGWLSATLVAGATGVLLLLAFKLTSNQPAIRRTRNDIDANLLALKLFKDSPLVTLRAQSRLILGAGRLFVLSLVPILLMALPVTLMLGQLALWYQARPLRVGEEAVLTLALGDPAGPGPEVRLRPTEAAEVVVGPVLIRSRREVCWQLKASRTGRHRLVLDVAGTPVTKDLAIGVGLMRASPLRPGWNWEEILLNPAEEPFRPDSPVRSLTIAYPARSSWTCGTDSWVYYWFAVSTLAALASRRVLGVNV